MFKYGVKIKNKLQKCQLRQRFEIMEDAIEYAKIEQKKPQFKKFHTIEIYEFWEDDFRNIEKLVAVVQDNKRLL